MIDTLRSMLLPLTPLAVIDVGMNLLKILAVAGGATVGGIGGGLLLRLIAKVSFGRNTPRVPLRIVQALGATGMGVFVYYWAFNSGGSGLGGAGTTFGGKGQGTSLSADLDAGKTKQDTAKADTLQEKPPAGTTIVRVEMLGGARVKGDRFYILDGEKEAKNLAELREAVRVQQQKDKVTIERIDIVIYEDSVAPDHPAVRDLEKWAKQNNLTVSVWKPAVLKVTLKVPDPLVSVTLAGRVAAASLLENLTVPA